MTESAIDALNDAWEQFNEYNNRTKEQKILFLMEQIRRFDASYYSQEEVNQFVKGRFLTFLGPLPTSGYPEPQFVRAGFQTANSPLTAPLFRLNDSWNQFNQYAQRSIEEMIDWLIMQQTEVNGTARNITDETRDQFIAEVYLAI